MQKLWRFIEWTNNESLGDTLLFLSLSLSLLVNVWMVEYRKSINNWKDLSEGTLYIESMMMVTFYKFWKLVHFILYLQILSTNIQFILLHKFEMHTSRTCYCFSCWSFAMPNWPPCSIFLCFCSRTTVYSNLVSFEYSQQ